MSTRAASRAALAFTPPCLARSVAEPPSGADWVHEIKFDGYRVQALVEGDRVRLLSRNAIDWTERFGRVVEDLAALQARDAAIDCEAVVLDSAGRSRFSALQRELKLGPRAEIQLMAFDLLHLGARSTATLPLLARKSKLERLLARPLPRGLLRYSSHMTGEGPQILREACALRLEGIISKRIDLLYRSGRLGDWTKCKCVSADPFVVIGYVPSKAQEGVVGSLVLGFYERGQLVYAGRVGTGFAVGEARSMAEDLAVTIVSAPALAKLLTREQRAGVIWVAPALVAQVEYRDVTADQILRQASFAHFRYDKRPEEIRRPPAFERAGR